MTREEIMKGLECCQTQYNKTCEECPYKNHKTPYISAVPCSHFLLADAFGLMKELLKEN